jgi:DNA-binding SARP family transcriptional activator
MRGAGVVRVSLLGGFSVSVEGRRIGEDGWRLKKGASLVKLLSLAPGHGMHRERITGLLWPHLDAEAAANNFHYALHAARNALEPAAAPSRYLGLAGEWLALCPESDLWVDTEAFEEAAGAARRSRTPAAYQAATDLYAGELLPEDRYDAWAEERREELRMLLLALLVEMARLREERGEFEAATEALGRVVALEPAHEEARAGLAHLHGLSGRRREASRQHERLVAEVLEREGGLERGTEVRHLHLEVVGGRHAPAPERGER